MPPGTAVWSACVSLDPCSIAREGPHNRYQDDSADDGENQAGPAKWVAPSRARKAEKLRNESADKLPVLRPQGSHSEPSVQLSYFPVYTLRDRLQPHGFITAKVNAVSEVTLLVASASTNAPTVAVRFESLF